MKYLLSALRLTEKDKYKRARNFKARCLPKIPPLLYKVHALFIKHLSHLCKRRIGYQRSTRTRFTKSKKISCFTIVEEVEKKKDVGFFFRGKKKGGGGGGAQR